MRVHSTASYQRSHAIQAQARQVSLLRLLLLAVGAAVVVVAPGLTRPPGAQLLPIAFWLLLAVSALTLVLAATVKLVHERWQLALHLVLDLLWIGILLACTGGSASAAVVLPFAVVLTANLLLPGYALWLFSSLAALVITGASAFYLAGRPPMPDSWLAVNKPLSDAPRILGTLPIQIAALFLVDLLAQLLVRRAADQRIFTGLLLDQLGEGVIAVDKSGSIAYCNAEAIRLLGIRPALEPLGQSAAQILRGDSLQPVRGLLTSRPPAVIRLDAHNGAHLTVRSGELVDRHGRQIGLTLCIADETRLRQLEADARRSERLAALGEMAAGIAHEIRNPLTSLRGCAQELAQMSRQRSAAAGGTAEDDLELSRILVTEADRLERIVSDFLGFARLREPGRQRLELVPLFAELEILVRARRDLPPDLHLEIYAAPGTAVAGDPDQMRQVLLNLIVNALDALRGVAAPRLEIRAEPAEPDAPIEGRAIALVVADNGCGIPPDQIERVFTPFFSTKAQGTGLGLSLVNRIIHSHGGVFRLQSAPGAGTTAMVWLASA